MVSKRSHQLRHLPSGELGDRQAAELLRQITLLGEYVSFSDDVLLRAVFQQQLPANSQIVLAASTTTKFFTLVLADAVMKVATPDCLEPRRLRPVSSEPHGTPLSKGFHQQSRQAELIVHVAVLPAYQCHDLGVSVQIL